MYINGDFRSKKKKKKTKNLGIIIYIKGREIWDLMKPMALQFVHTIFS